MRFVVITVAALITLGLAAKLILSGLRSMERTKQNPPEVAGGV